MSVSVVCWLKEPLDRTLEFAGWYLSLGVDRLILFFDDPDDPAIAHVSQHDAITAIPCDAAFWHDLGLSAGASHPVRQKAALTFGYRQARTDWVLTVDADEFLYFSQGSLREFLDRLPSEVQVASFSVAENIRGHGEEHRFRIAIPDSVIAQIYETPARWLSKRGGLIGHDEGKTIARTGMVLQEMHQHYPIGPDGRPLPLVKVDGRDTGIWLLHYFDQGWEAWRRRFDRKGGRSFGGRMTRYLKQILETDPEPDIRLRAVYDDLHAFPDERFDRLEGAGGGLRFAPDFGDCRRRHFGPPD